MIRANNPYYETNDRTFKDLGSVDRGADPHGAFRFSFHPIGHVGAFGALRWGRAMLPFAAALLDSAARIFADDDERYDARY